MKSIRVYSLRVTKIIKEIKFEAVWSKLEAKNLLVLAAVLATLANHVVILITRIKGHITKDNKSHIC